MDFVFPASNKILFLSLKNGWYRRNKVLIEELSTPAPGSQDLHFQTRYSQPFFIQCMACLWKQYWSYWRNPPYTAVRLILTTFIALLLGTIFWDLGSKRYKISYYTLMAIGQSI